MGLSRNPPENAWCEQADFANPPPLPAALKGIEVAVGLQLRSAARRFRDQRGQRSPHERRSSRSQTASFKRKPATTGSFGRLHAIAEKALPDSGMGGTFLRPVFFMRTLLFFADSIKGGKPIAATSNGKMVWVAVSLLAELTAAVLTGSAPHASKAHTLRAVLLTALPRCRKCCAQSAANPSNTPAHPHVLPS